MQIFVGKTDCTLGSAVAVWVGRFLIFLALTPDIKAATAFADKRFPQWLHQPADPNELKKLRDYLNAAIHDDQILLPWAAILMGSPFDLLVWEVLKNIPPKTLTTYKKIAEAIGHPKASRAVGGAVGRNPISIAIPCHRVIASDGSLGGYAWGLDIKKALLAGNA